MITFVDAPGIVLDASKYIMEFDDPITVKEAIDFILSQDNKQGVIEIEDINNDLNAMSIPYKDHKLSGETDSDIAEMLVVEGKATFWPRSRSFDVIILYTEDETGGM